jgi:hypothetical protein
VPRNRPEGPEGGRGIALVFLDLGARRGWVVSTTPRPLYHWERPGTHCTGGWVGPRAGLDVCEETYLEYVILIAFSLQQWSRERATVLSYTYIACVVQYL